MWQAALLALVALAGAPLRPSAGANPQWNPETHPYEFACRDILLYADRQISVAVPPDSLLLAELGFGPAAADPYVQWLEQHPEVVLWPTLRALAHQPERAVDRTYLPRELAIRTWGVLLRLRYADQHAAGMFTLEGEQRSLLFDAERAHTPEVDQMLEDCRTRLATSAR